MMSHLHVVDYLPAQITDQTDGYTKLVHVNCCQISSLNFTLNDLAMMMTSLLHYAIVRLLFDEYCLGQCQPSYFIRQ